jgi:long-chain fatty acid transport protein
MRNNLVRGTLAGGNFLLVLVLSGVAAAQQTSPAISSTLLSAPVGAGARAAGMGGAFIAVADDATAASWNPAGLALLDRPQTSFAGDASRIVDSVPSYELTRTFNSGLRVLESGPATTSTRRSRDPGYASIVYPLRLRSWRIVPQFSYRRAVKANLSRRSTQPYLYTESTGLRESGTDALTFDGGRGIDLYSAAAGVRLHRLLTVGASLNVWRGESNGGDLRTVAGIYSLGTLTGTLSPSSYQTNYKESFDGTNIDLGVLATPFSRLRIGAVVRKNLTVTRTYDYTRQYTNWSGGLGSETYNEHGDIAWPLSVGIGGAVMPLRALTVSTDYWRSSWSKATYRFTSSDTQTISGRNATIEASGKVIYPAMYDPEAGVRPYFNVPQRDSWQLRSGAEFVWRQSSSRTFGGIPLRGGVYRNRSLLPESNGEERIGTGATAGAGVLWGRFAIDIAYVRETVRGKTAEFPTTAFSGFSMSQQEGGVDRTVLRQVVFSVGARF